MTTLVAPQPYELELCPAAEADRLAEDLWEGRLPAVFSPAEREFAANLRLPKRRRDWLAGRLAAKRLLARRLPGLRLDQIVVLPRPDGSPRVDVPGRPDFRRWPVSIAHSAAGAAAALGRAGGLVGADLEAVEPRSPAWIALFTHESERSDSLAGSPLEQTRLWTLKEAVAKLLGTGFSVGFHDIRLLPAHDGRRLELSGQAFVRWEALGRPAIAFDSQEVLGSVLSVAYSLEGDSYARH